MTNHLTHPLELQTHSLLHSLVLEQKPLLASLEQMGELNWMHLHFLSPSGLDLDERVLESDSLFLVSSTLHSVSSVHLISTNRHSKCVGD